MTRISLFMLACCLSAIALAEDWQAVKLKSGSVSYGSISEAGDSLSVDGKFTDISRIYDVLEEKDKFVRISDGTNSGWVSRARLTPVTNSVPAASDGPHPDKRSEANAAKDNDEANRTDPKTQVDYNNRGNERAVLKDY